MKLFFNFGVIFALSCVLFGCSLSGYQLPEYEKIADKITAETAIKLEKEKGLILAGTGGGMMHDIQEMSMAFHFYYKSVDTKTARELLVYSVEEYLSAINSNEKVRPYLHNYPFTSQNVEIVIYFYNPDRSDVSLGKLSIAAAKPRKVVYYIDYPEKHTIKAVYEETYQDALKVVSHK